MPSREVTRVATVPRSTTTLPDADAPDTWVLERARLQILRSTVLICLLIALGNLIGSVAGFTASGQGVVGPATTLAAVWCVVWTLAAAFPELTARCFTSWRLTALTLAAANAWTVAVTGGTDSPLLAVCMYAGWIASVVVGARSALLVSMMITCSIVAGYLLSGASIHDVLAGPHRYSAVSVAVLPVLAGIAGVLLTAVTNTAFARLAVTVDGLRRGMKASTPALTAVLAGGPILALPAATSRISRAPTAGAPLTEAETEVVALLVDGHAPKQIARLRGVALSTVRSQIKSAKRKTGARTINDLASATWDERG